MSSRLAWHIAQLNVGYPIAPLDTEELRGFVEMLEPVNALADKAPGFVWRLQTEDGDATAIRGFADSRLLMNMSVWESIESLAAFVFEGEHAAIMRQRRQWFERMDRAYACLWWVPAGTVPAVADAEPRLTALQERGPTPFAFTFRRVFRPPDAPDGGDTSSVAVADDWFCGV
jgi:hypothetical protein